MRVARRRADSATAMASTVFSIPSMGEVAEGLGPLPSAKKQVAFA